MTVETQDSEKTTQPRQVASNDALEVRHTAEPPRLEIFERQQVHLHEDVDGDMYPAAKHGGAAGKAGGGKKSGPKNAAVASFAEATAKKP